MITISLLFFSVNCNGSVSTKTARRKFSLTSNYKFKCLNSSFTHKSQTTINYEDLNYKVIDCISNFSFNAKKYEYCGNSIKVLSLFDYPI